MNFMTSVFAVFFVDAVCAAMHFNQEETFIILMMTTVLYFMAKFIISMIEKWNSVG